MFMNKQTKTIVIVVVAIVVVGGAYYGINRWRQQRLVNQYLKGIYGVDAGLLNKITGGVAGNGFTAQIAAEIAKEEAKQKADEAKEATKTPEDKYNATEEMTTYDANSKAVADGAKEIMDKVFGKSKVTAISTGMYGGEVLGSGVVEFTIARLTTGADLGAMSKAFTDKGFEIIQSGIEDKNANLMASSDNVIYTVSFDIGGQTVGMIVMKSNS